MKLKFLVIALLLGLPSFGWAKAPANTDGNTPDRKLGWTAGVGAIYIRQVYREMDNRFIPIPTLAYRGPRLSVFGPRVNYLLFQPGRVKINAVGAWRFAGYDPKDSPYFEGMKRRQDTLEAGLEAEVQLAHKIGLQVQWRADTLGHHNGYEVETSVRKVFGEKKFNLAISMDWNYLSSNLTNTYYGVEPQEARPGRPAYVPGPSQNISAGGMVFYRTGKRMSLFAGFQASWLAHEITHSPIVEKNIETRSFTGVMWNLG